MRGRLFSLVDLKFIEPRSVINAHLTRRVVFTGIYGYWKSWMQPTAVPRLTGSCWMTPAEPQMLSCLLWSLQQLALWFLPVTGGRRDISLEITSKPAVLHKFSSAPFLIPVKYFSDSMWTFRLLMLSFHSSGCFFGSQNDSELLFLRCCCISTHWHVVLPADYSTQLTNPLPLRNWEALLVCCLTTDKYPNGNAPNILSQSLWTPWYYNS